MKVKELREFLELSRDDAEVVYCGPIKDEPIRAERDKYGNVIIMSDVVVEEHNGSDHTH